MKRERGTGGFALCATVGALLLAAPALAQVPQAPGLKIGEGRLHPFLELDGRFDSTVGFFNRDTAGNVIPSPEIVLHARPGLKFNLETPATFVNFNGSGEYLWYTGLLSPSSTSLSRFQANVALDAKFNTDGAVQVDIGDNLVRSDRTQNPAVGVGVISLFNMAYLAVPIHPGGRALEVTPRVAWSVEFFEPLLTGLVQGCTDPNDITCNPGLVGQMNYNNVNFGLNGKWKFLPKTALLLDANLDWRTYFSASAANRPATLLRVQAGIAGLVTPRIAVTLIAGYGGDLSQLGAMGVPLHTPIGTAEISYTVSEKTRVALGYARNAQPVPSLGAMINDRGYLRGGISLLGGRLQLNAQLAADNFMYIAAVARNDFLLSASVTPQVIIASWFDVSAGYTLGFRTSTATISSVNFLRHEALLRLNFHY